MLIHLWNWLHNHAWNLILTHCGIFNVSLNNRIHFRKNYPGKNRYLLVVERTNVYFLPKIKWKTTGTSGQYLHHLSWWFSEGSTSYRDNYLKWPQATAWPLAEPREGGVIRDARASRVKILSFSCNFRQKNCKRIGKYVHFGSWRPLRNILDPPLIFMWAPVRCCKIKLKAPG